MTPPRRAIRPLVALLTALLILPSLTAAASAPAAPAAGGDAWVGPLLRAAAREDPHTPRALILGFDAVPRDGVVARLAHQGFHPHAFEHVPVVAVHAAPRDLPRLLETPGVVSATVDRPLEWMGAHDAALPTARTGNFGGTGDNLTRADAARAMGYDGAGVGVAIVDTGVNGHHPGLRPEALGGPLAQNVKVVIGRDRVVTRAPPLPLNAYLEDQVDTDTTGGHGTHVAGIAAGAWTPDSALGGRAPGADLLGFGTGETLAVLWVVAAFDWVLEHREAHNIRVVSNSWGISGPPAPLDPVNLATEALDDAGVLVIFSAGNSGPAPRTLNVYAQPPHVLAVGATTLSGAVASFSSRGDPHVGKPGPDLVAPGANIVAPRSAPVSAMDTSLRPPTFDAALVAPEHVANYRALSGTSMAAPQVAGVAALLFQADPSLTPAEARDILTATARPLFGHETQSAGAGLVDAQGAVRAALGLDAIPREHVRPTEVVEAGGAVAIPFHGALVGAARKSSANLHELPFPVRLPADGLTLTANVTPLAGAHAAPPEALGVTLTLHGADGRPVLTEAVNATDAHGNLTLTATVANHTLEAHARPGWNGGYWTATLTAEAGAVAYDVTATVAYPDGELPPVNHTPPPPPPPLPERVPHDPILIATNADFTEENGVVAGSGTAADPYVIAGWEIDAGDATPGITIGGPLGTTDHVVIRNVRVHDAVSYCIKLENAHNVRVEQSHVDGCGWGVYASHGATGITVADSVLEVNERAVALYGVSDARVEGNTIRQSSENAIVVSQGATQGSTVSTGIRILDNTLVGADSHLSLLTPGTFGVTVRNNRLGGGATVELGSGTHDNAISGTEWLDGTPRYEKSVLGVETPEATPLNTVVDAGSHRAPDAAGHVCFDDATVEAHPSLSVVQVAWDFGDGAQQAGDAQPCHGYAPDALPTTARLIVTVQEATGERRVLEDAVTVG